MGAQGLQVSSEQTKELILDAIENGLSAKNERVLFYDGISNFPYVVRHIEKGAREGEYILSGVADTLKRGRHHVQIELSLNDGTGKFL